MAAELRMIMRTEEFMAVGGENELLPRGLDPYLRQSFRNAGLRVVVVPGIIYSHLPPSTLPKLLRQFFRNGRHAAFCNKYYPQWVIETPDEHGEFEFRVPFSKRVWRYAYNMIKAVWQGRKVYLYSELSYAFGFLVGFLFLWESNSNPCIPDQNG